MATAMLGTSGFSVLIVCLPPFLRIGYLTGSISKTVPDFQQHTYLFPPPREIGKMQLLHHSISVIPLRKTSMKQARGQANLFFIPLLRTVSISFKRSVIIAVSKPAILNKKFQRDTPCACENSLPLMSPSSTAADTLC
jgi:hypothetical protein